MNEQIYESLQKLLIRNNIQVDQQELKLQLLSHPTYPSLHALTGVLQHFRISNLALRLPVSAATIGQLPQYFLASINDEQGKQLVLAERKKSGIKISYEATTALKNQEDFLATWDGIVLAVEKEEKLGAIRSQSGKLFRQIIFGLGALVLLSILLLGQNTLWAVAHILLSLIGLGLSILIIEQELGMPSKAANTFCHLSEKTSCDEALRADGATLWGFLKLSDLSVITFTSFSLTWLLLFIGGTTDVVLLPALSALSIPIIIYAVYYQYVVVQKWCPLCLSIATVLLLQAALLGAIDLSWSSLSTPFPGLLLGGVAVGSAGFWWWFKSFLTHKIQLEREWVDHLRFKRQFSLFHTLHQQGHLLQQHGDLPGEIVLGNPAAPLEIVLATNPFCKHCREAHADMERLLAAAEGRLKVIIRFNIPRSIKDNRAYEISAQLLYIFQERGEAACRKALHEVFAERPDLDAWLGRQAEPTPPICDTILTQQNEWCQANGISFTPAVFLNKKAFPSEYDRTDLRYFIDDLVDLATPITA